MLVQSGWFVLNGINPEPWTSPEVEVIWRKGRKPAPNVHKREGLRVYQEAVAEEFRQRYPLVKPWEGQIELAFYFWRELPLGQIIDGRNRRAHTADATNLQKATEDALQGVLYANDREVRSVASMIVEQGAEVEPRILIRISNFVPAPQWVADKADELTERIAVPDRRAPTTDDNLF